VRRASGGWGKRGEDLPRTRTTVVIFEHCGPSVLRDMNDAYERKGVKREERRYIKGA
jgi:hypothetical protein